VLLLGPGRGLRVQILQGGRIADDATKAPDHEQALSETFTDATYHVEAGHTRGKVAVCVRSTALDRTDQSSRVGAATGSRPTRCT
jgi:hypothetical protein